MTDHRLLALTLSRPWNIPVVKGYKWIENRTWAPPAGLLKPGQWFAIHAGKSWDEGCIPMAQRLGLPISMFDRQHLGHSAIVGVVRFAGTVTDSDDPWFFGPVGWALDRAVEIAPVPCRGYQKLWTVPPPIADQVREAFRRASVAP